MPCLIAGVASHHLNGAPSMSMTVQGFYVTEHFLHALRRLRYKHRIRLVWVDAICIKQSNLLERNNQVRVMKQMYSQARVVVIWLGELTRPSLLAKDIPPLLTGTMTSVLSLDYQQSNTGMLGESFVRGS